MQTVLWIYEVQRHVCYTYVIHLNQLDKDILFRSSQALFFPTTYNNVFKRTNTNLVIWCRNR
jgi:hypothetical protein